MHVTLQQLVGPTGTRQDAAVAFDVHVPHTHTQGCVPSILNPCCCVAALSAYIGVLAVAGFALA